MKQYLSLILIVQLFLFSCGQKDPAPTVVPGGLTPGKYENALPSWVREGAVYEIFVRNFTPEGTFSAIIPRLPEIKAMGVKTLWFMPFHPIGLEKRKDSPSDFGSPYSIRDYYAVSPELGTLSDLKDLITAAHSQGLKVIFDLVANHTSWDNPWLKSHPDWYTQDETGTILSPNPDWTDVADLNYESPALRAEMIKVMTFWIKDMDFDGLRADAAVMVPLDFWKQAIESLKQIKPLLLLAESDKTSLLSAGFNMLYGWPGYNSLKKVFNAGSPASFWVKQAIKERDSLLGAETLRWVTNHDETAWDDVPSKVFISPEGEKAASVASFLVGGIPLIYNGQETGRMEKVGLFVKTNYDWSAGDQTRAFYKDLVSLWKKSPAFSQGQAVAPKDFQSKQIAAYFRQGGGESWFVAVNLTPDKVSASVPEDIKSGSWKVEHPQTEVGKKLLGKLILGPFEWVVAKQE